MDLYDYTEYFFSHQKAQKNSLDKWLIKLIRLDWVD